MSNWINAGEAKRVKHPEWKHTIEDLCGLMGNFPKENWDGRQEEYAVRAISFVMSNLERRGLIDDQFMDIREEFKL